MKKLAVLLAGAMLMMGMATSAMALQLRASTDGSTWSYFLDLDNDGMIYASLNSFGNFKLQTNVMGNNNSSGINNANLSISSLETTSNAVGGGTLYIQLSEVGFNFAQPAVTTFTGLSLLQGTATVEQKTFWGAGSNYFTEANAIDTRSINTQISKNWYTNFASPITGLFSITEELKITQAANTQTQVSAYMDVTPVPEPGTMVLLGFGMLGLAIYGKRRMNKEA